MNIKNDIASNVKKLKESLTSEDISFLELKCGESDAVIVFANELVDKNAIGKLILEPATKIKGKFTAETAEKTFLSPEKEKINTITEVVDAVCQGETVIIIDGINFAFSFGLKMFNQRAISEPPTSTVIKGPREGFVENLPVNISLMRRRIKSNNLIFENISVGKYSNTPVTICYVKGIADQKLVNKVRKKLKKISIDAILDSSYISKFLGEHKTAIFKQVGNTEKPDILASKILEGRVAVFVDGSPIALTVPYLLIEDFQSPSDYYSSPSNATISRCLRLISVLISLLLPAFFVSAELFHLQFIPISFLLTIVNSIKGIPLSPSYEMFFTLLIFEILNEASVRMPKYVGMVVSIVGGLVLGETAVTAGIISAPTLMIIALSGICLYTVPELEQTFSVIRLIFLVIAGSFGAYGIIITLGILLVYLVSFETFNTPLFAPFAPLVKEDLKDTFYRGFIEENKYRPLSLRPKNKKRED